MDLFPDENKRPQSLCFAPTVTLLRSLRCLVTFSAVDWQLGSSLTLPINQNLTGLKFELLLNQNETFDLCDESHVRRQRGGFISEHAELWSCLLGTRKPKHFNQFNY